METMHEEPEEPRTKLYNELGDPAPRFFNWCCAVAAIAFFYLLLNWSSAATAGYRYARLQREFETQSAGRVDLKKLIESRRFKPLFWFHSDMLKRIRPMFDYVANGDLVAASQFLDRTDSPKHPLLFVMTARLKNIVSEDARWQRLSREESLFSEREPQLWAQYQELREAEAKLFAFQVRFPADHKFEFYKEGILKGIPVLPGLPDSLIAMDDLTAAAPAFDPDDKASLKSFYELIQSSQEVAKQITKAEDSARARVGARESLRNAQERGTREAKTLLRQLLIDLTKQTFPVGVRRNYAFLSRTFSRLGFRLPELHLDERTHELTSDEVENILSLEPESA